MTGWQMAVWGALLASGWTCVQAQDARGGAGVYDVRILDAAGRPVSRVMLDVGKDGDASALPHDNSSWEAFWQTRAEGEAPRGETRQVQVQVFSPRRCPTGDQMELAVVAHGTVVRGGVDPQGQPWFKLAMREVVGWDKERDGACMRIAPVLSYLNVEGVPGTREMRAAGSGGQIYTVKIERRLPSDATQR